MKNFQCSCCNGGRDISLVFGLGQGDAYPYPFALATPVLHKLGFIHDMVRRKTRGYQVEPV